MILPSASSMRMKTSQSRSRGAALAAERLDELVEEAEALVLEGAVDAVDPLHLAVALGDQGVVELVLVDAVAAAVLGHVAGGVGGGEHAGRGRRCRR